MTDFDDKLSKRLEGFNLRYELFPWQKNLLREINEKFSIMKEKPGGSVFRYQLIGAYGVGKTYLLCIIMVQYMLFCASNFPSQKFKGVVFSGTGAQLETTLWFDLKEMICESKFANDFVITSRKIFLKGYENKIECSARNVPVSSGAKVAGMHGENVLVIFDEATTIPDYLFDKAATFFTQCNGLWLVSGNGERTGCRFHQNYIDDSKNTWKNLTINRFDLGIPDDPYIESVIMDYGEESDMYKVNVLGQFTEMSSGFLFPEYVIQRAVGKYTGATCDSHVVLSCDVASGHGNDFSTIVIRSWRTVVLLKRFKTDTADFTEIIKEYSKEYHPQAIIVDEVGCGQGVYDALSAFYGERMRVIAMQCGAPANNSDFFENKKAELYYTALGFLKRHGSIPDSKEFVEELRRIQFCISTKGRTQIVSKRDSKDPSPDIVDAFAYSFAVDPESYNVTKRYFDDAVSVSAGGYY